MLEYMSNNENIKIDLEIFKDKLIEYEQDNDLEVSESIINKYNELKKTYHCFNIKYDPKSVWEKKKHKTKNNILYKNKLFTFTTKINNNINDANKNIIGLLNKITDVNKNTILNSIEKIILDNNDNENKELFSIVFNYIEKKYDKLYITILKLFENNNNNNNIIYDYINNYILKKLWLPNEYIINNNILDDNLYDEYCDYLKWKNKQLNYIKTFNFIMNENTDKYNIIYNLLCNDLYDVFNYYLINNNFKYLLDYILELFEILINHSDNIYINKFKDIDTYKLDNSTKFLIYNIIKK